MTTTEFLALCFTPVNLPFTVLLILVFLYWILVIVGAVGLDMFDIDLDGDLGSDGDFGADAPATSIGGAVLHFFNIGEVPLMIVVSIFVFSLWEISILASYYLGDALGTATTLVLLVPNVLISLLIAKVGSMPFRAIFKHLNTGIDEPVKIVGKTCVIRTLEATPTAGQAELITAGSPLLLNVRTREGLTLPKGAEAVVLAHNPDNDTYVVDRVDNARVL